MEFRHYTFYLHQFEFLENFEEVIFPFMSIVTFPENCEKIHSYLVIS